MSHNSVYLHVIIAIMVLLVLFYQKNELRFFSQTG